MSFTSTEIIKFSDQTMELVKNIDVYEILQSSVNFKKVGNTLQGLCCFHDEKTPSLTVYPQSNSYYCFGCGASGNVITAYKELHGVGFGEAVKSLARQYNIPVEYGKPTNGTKPTRKAKTQAKKSQVNHGIEPIETAYCSEAVFSPAENGEQTLTKKQLPKWFVQWFNKQYQGKTLPESVKKIVFSYSETQQIQRYEWEDHSKAKGYNKTIRPFFFDGKNWLMGDGKDDWMPYKFNEVIKSGADKWILGVEGEKCADSLQHIPVITWHKWDKDSIILSLSMLKDNGVKGLVYIPDNDKAGQEKAQKIIDCGIDAQFPILIVDMQNIWSECPEAGDIADFMQEKQVTEFELKEILKQQIFAIQKNQQSITEEFNAEPVKSNQDIDVYQEVKNIYFSNLLESEKTFKYSELGVKGYELKRLLELLENESIHQVARQELPGILDNFIPTRNQDIDLSRYLHGDGGDFARSLKVVCEQSIVPQANAFVTLLSAAAPFIGKKSQVVIKAAANYTQPCIFWTGIVGYSGTNKSSIQKTIIAVLDEMESKEFQDYKLLKDEYDKLAKKGEENLPEPPKRKRYLTKDATLATLEAIVGENGGSILYWKEELSGLVQSRNKYGVGGDKQAELDQWNGGSIMVDRAQRQICIDKSAISRTGTIQFEVLKEIAGDFKDHDGWFARWLFSAVEPGPRYLNLTGNDDIDTGIKDRLKQLFKTLQCFENRDYILSFEAKQIFEQWNRYTVDASREETSLGLQLAYPKMEAYVARLALWLHCVNYALVGQVPPAAIAGYTMSLAVELGQFFLKQVQFIHAANSPDAGLIGDALKIYEYLKTQANGRSAIDIKRYRYNKDRSKKTASIREICETLVHSGYLGKTGDLYFVNTLVKKVDLPVNLVNQPQDKDSSLSVNKKVDLVDQKLTIESTESTNDMAMVSEVEFKKVDFLTDRALPVNEIEDVIPQEVEEVQRILYPENFPEPAPVPFCQDLACNPLEVGDRVVDVEDRTFRGVITKITSVDHTRDKYNPCVEFKLSIQWDDGRSIDNYDPIFVVKESWYESQKRDS